MCLCYKIFGVFFPLHAVIADFSKWKRTTKINDTSIDTGALFELRVWCQLEVIVHLQRNVVYCLICNEFLLLWLFCYHSVSHFDLGAKFMISPLTTSLLRSRTVCWGKGKDCSEAEHDNLQAPIPLRTVQQPFQWGGSWQEVFTWGSFTVQLVLMSSIKTQTSYVSFIHIQHQCFKQNCRKEQINVCSSLYLH